MASSLGYNGGLTLAMQVKDRAAAADWYRDTLGMQFLFDAPEIGWCELATHTKGVNIGLSEVESPKVGAGPVPTFGVNDLDAARDRLQSLKVRFDGETMTIPGLVKLATFFDPDGNTLMLYQDLSAAQ